jgi:F-type H+-transporting ATPase subunit a
VSTDPAASPEVRARQAASASEAVTASDLAAPEAGAVPESGAAPEAGAVPPAGSKTRRNILLLLIVAVVAFDIAAAILLPPFPKGEPGKPISGIGDLIMANLEFPAPEVVWPAPAPGEPHEALPIVGASVSYTNSLFTMLLVTLVLVVVFFIAGRMIRPVPGRFSNAVEFIWESLENWALSLGGPDARRHIPLFCAFFIFILFSNWSGLLPFFGRLGLPIEVAGQHIELGLRAPTSDVNVTIGLALVAFFYFHYQGFRHLGVRGYLGKFFVFSGFRRGIATGVIDLFVGLIEFLLEFIKPVTLAMRLFGNIFGGEVALGVITALTIVLIPAAMLLLEGLLNFVQALIFSTLMLMYTIIAVESHHDEEHAAPEFADVPEGGMGPALETMRAGSH